jgi:hypothetical protein
MLLCNDNLWILSINKSLQGVPRPGAGFHSRIPAFPHSRIRAFAHSRIPAFARDCLALARGSSPIRAFPHSRIRAFPHSRIRQGLPRPGAGISRYKPLFKIGKGSQVTKGVIRRLARPKSS